MFDDAMLSGDRAAEAVYAGAWRISEESEILPAISVESLVSSDAKMIGGKFTDISVRLYVRRSIWVSSGANKESLIEVHVDGAWTKCRIKEIEHEGHGGVVLVCGPSGVRL